MRRIYCYCVIHYLMLVIALCPVSVIKELLTYLLTCI